MHCGRGLPDKPEPLKNQEGPGCRLGKSLSAIRMGDEKDGHLVKTPETPESGRHWRTKVGGTAGMLRSKVSSCTIPGQPWSSNLIPLYFHSWL